MPLKVGIVGLPNVGKSTLFNAITNSQVEAANYPFATINPNVGVVEVPDERMHNLIEIFQPHKAIYTTFEFYDIAGLIAGASKGEGLGNTFLANIRDTDAICMVVRCFENKDITHVEGSIDPLRDIEIINLELIIADQEQIEKRINKIAKRAQTLKQKDDVFEYELLQKLDQQLAANKLLKDLVLTPEEHKAIKNFNLLTIKPFIYVANIAETDLQTKTNPYVEKVQQYAKDNNIEVVTICAQVEQELSTLNEEEKTIFMAEYGIQESGLSQLIKKSYALLGLQTFFTAGKQEVRAWTFKKGATAPECAGIIHTDFEKGFIKADIYAYQDLITYGSEKAVKENCKMRSEGKTYIMQDGDICFFKFNV
ncbi:redox-regulated ATPase YchF [Spiroplasma eriocheiris]|uniref:Ribosome-binding ATPase YchF n=1 Tax=Spiroplasma eriocheiris TaxID=315358 RepID=A0A0H3XHL3_9MOLU|nr:redox-regulated ATPase YchF [Spiroplasma eriocheiris]AHF57358.1 GTP-dependent nucleic acid-binding protein [Spiroplasma eriocheiris CCTCC M 207170]AKM53815.1 GTP-dependent nucleic acid-binding protein EngD [Spiroplasma eriocheiris]